MNLFSHLCVEPTYEPIAAGAVLMRSFAYSQAGYIMEAVEAVAAAAPFRQMKTPGGYQMSVAMTSCGSRAWVSDETGGRHLTDGTVTADGRPGAPPMPMLLRSLAEEAADRAGFPRFRPDSCHMNRYEPRAKLGLHQDRGEADLRSPIVSISLGLQAVFLFGGLERSDPVRHILLEHGDVFVWGGPSRMRYHGVQPVKPGSHPLVGSYRYNLTFRKTV